MSFIKDAGDSLLRYTEKIVSKTEEYAKIGKITLDIKRLESQIQKAYREIGEHTFNSLSNGTGTVGMNDDFISGKCNLIKDTTEAISQKKNDIEEIKKAAREGSASASYPSTPSNSTGTETNQEGGNRNENE